MSGRNKKRRRKSRSAAIYLPVAVLLALFIGIFGTSVFLRVMNIEVAGKSRYEAEEIIKKSGISIGDNLLLIDTNSAVIKIREEMPYISEIKISHRWPDTVSIDIKESSASAVINSQGNNWIIDADARILEKSAGVTRGLIRVHGITPLEPKEGKRIEVSQNSEAKLDYMCVVIKAIEEQGLQNKIDELNVSNIANITFIYDSRLTIAIGMADNVPYKLEMMLEFISKRPELQSAVGTIDLTGEMFIFIPE